VPRTAPTPTTTPTTAVDAPARGGRVQLALNVSDLEASVAFYSAMFGVEPHKRRPGYANFAVAEPPLKLVLIETSEGTRGTGTAGALNHLGVEVDTADEVAAAVTRLAGQGLVTATEDQVACCFAVQDKVWSHDPDGAPWEVYTVTATTDVGTRSGTAADPRAGTDPTTGDTCCTTTATAEPADPEVHTVPVRTPAARG
jgi:catechol 2,3-dioxygenase-like lactoylglutathione lyase family enzyme